MALTISAEVLAEAKARADLGDVAGAWAVLSAAGDRYATNAERIIAEWQDPQSLYAQIVRSHWDRVVNDPMDRMIGVGPTQPTDFN